MIAALKANLKNIPGWRTPDKLVMFSVDDYCNVRLDSPAAKRRLIDAGVVLANEFDCLDSVETRSDLERLFDVLSSARDAYGHPACFTCYSNCANPDFDELNGGQGLYRYKTVEETFSRLSAEQPHAYEGTWELWREGIREGLLRPQFHGREHLNIELINRQLISKDPILMASIKNHSMVGLQSEPSLPGVSFTAALAVADGSELELHKEIIQDGLRLFELIFGFPSSTFTPPATQINPRLYPFLDSVGLKAIDKPQRCMRKLDGSTYKREWNVLGRHSEYTHINLVRNVVFEPCKDMVADPVGYALSQIEAAFRWKKPAIISSHRVNFGGHIEPANRDQGLAALGRLLGGIVKRWPDVQFTTAENLVARIQASH